MPDVSGDAKFYTEVWGLAPVAEEKGSVYLRGTGRVSPHSRAASAAQTELLSITFSARSKADVDALHAAVVAAVPATGADAVTAPAPLAAPGGGYGFAFKDPQGRIFRIVSGDARHADAKPAADRPERLSHVVLNSTDVALATRFFVDALGFKFSDRHASWISSAATATTTASPSPMRKPIRCITSLS